MNYGFWQQLERPITVLAPMAGVTDAAYRAIIAKYGKPPAMWTEFVPADGLVSEGRDNIIHDFWHTDIEHPIVAQIYGSNPEGMRGAAALAREMGFSGVDINMGCPAKTVEKHKCGAALINDPSLAQELVLAAKEGAGDLPVSVKTRIGYRRNEIESWLPALMETRPALIIFHARTRNEMSKVPARWKVITQAVEIAREIEPDDNLRPLIFGNGDIETPQEAKAMAIEVGCDGIMIGRGIFGNPWLFNPALKKEDLPLEEVLRVMLEHTELYIRLFDGIKPLELMKKHFKAYVAGFRGASELRAQLMDAQGYKEIEAVVLSAVPGVKA